IATDEVVRDCLASAGFDPGLADRGMLVSAETYAANLEEGVAKGAFGAPFYVVDTGGRFWGQDGREDLALYRAGRRKGQGRRRRVRLPRAEISRAWATSARAGRPCLAAGAGVKDTLNRDYGRVTGPPQTWGL